VVIKEPYLVRGDFGERRKQTEEERVSRQGCEEKKLVRGENEETAKPRCLAKKSGSKA